MDVEEERALINSAKYQFDCLVTAVREYGIQNCYLRQDIDERRAWIKELVDKINRLTAENAKLRKALDLMADDANWFPDGIEGSWCIFSDGSGKSVQEIAQRALDEKSEEDDG